MATTSESDQLLDKIKAREEDLRRRDREMRKREEQIKEKYDEMTLSRSNIDAMVQELEARETVVAEAEEKHGSLLKREAEIARAEKAMEDREKVVSDRTQEVISREQAAEALGRKLQKDYDDKLFPLAAREQEIQRRAGEVHASEVELEGKLRAFHKKVQNEEEREKHKERQLREHEQKLREMSARLDKRQNDVDAAFSDVQERLKAIKADQVEFESRDRDIKWKEDQLRTAHTEVSDIKQKLMEWEGKLDVRAEELDAAEANVALLKSQMEVKDFQLTEKLDRLLAAEKEVQLRGDDVNRQMAVVEETRAGAEARMGNIEDREAAADKREAELRDRKDRFEKQRQQLTTKEEEYARRLSVLQDRENSMRDWMIELEWREAAVSKRETNADMGAAPVRRDKTKLDEGHTAMMQERFNKGIVNMQLQQMKNSYLQSAAKRDKVASSKKDLERKADRETLLYHRQDDYSAQIEEETITEEMELQVNALQKQFTLCTGYFYGMDPATQQEVFSKDEMEGFRKAIEEEDNTRSETVFLRDVSKVPQAAVGVSDAKALQSLTKWCHRIRSLALKRQRNLLGARLASLSGVVDMVQAKQKAHPNAFPTKHYGKLKMEAAEAAAVHRKPKQYQLQPRAGGGYEAFATSGNSGRNTPVAAREGATTPPPVGEAPPEHEQLVEALPPYLRKHYGGEEVPEATEPTPDPAPEEERRSSAAPSDASPTHEEQPPPEPSEGGQPEKAASETDAKSEQQAPPAAEDPAQAQAAADAQAEAEAEEYENEVWE